MRPERGLYLRTFWLSLALLAIFWGNPSVQGADPEAFHKKFIQGNYAEVAREAEAALLRNEYGEDWPILAAKANMELGKYPEALRAIANNLYRYPGSVRIRLVGFYVYRQNGQEPRARALLEEINNIAGTRSWTLREPQNRVALGEAALLLGGDPKLVLDEFFSKAKKELPKLRDAYLAGGNMALDKHDFDLASKWFQEGLEQHPSDPDLLLGLAKSFEEDDRRQMMIHLQAALKANENHVPSYLVLVDHMVAAEEYEEAAKLLKKIQEINPNHPRAWAYRAVLAHLKNKPDEEKTAREQGLKFWKTNPEVDSLIGYKLSQKYRFAEGASYQRTALKMDANYLPARIQLAQDLLRLGEEAEGWLLANQVHEADGYDVAAYNLVTLHDNLAKFQTLTNDHFIVRMDPREAPIYGGRVLELLEKARTTLIAKYGLTIEKPILVEIFPDQKDFAIRTFGMPGGEGFLGVCFGAVITANSPGSRASHETNWEAMLWHEFCHVITLQMTKNKMPRWLSEGISVFEELQANKSWGQAMNPTYRKMILEGEMAPIGELSSLFLSPKTPMHLQFAYYQSSLVVEFVVQKFGQDKLVAILKDLGQGVEINASLEKHTAALATLEKEFETFAKEKARALGKDLEWEQPAENVTLTEEWVDRHPTNLHGLTWLAGKKIREKKWAEAKVPLKKLVELYPEQVGRGNAYERLAMVHRELKETDLELEILTKWAERDAEAVDAYNRLMELNAEKKSWPEVELNATRFLAVNPMLPSPYRWLAKGAEETKKFDVAARAYQTLLKLHPSDPAQLHFRLAKLYHEQGKTNALQHVLYALEEAPRYREAHRLLLEIKQGKSKDSPINGTP